MAVSFGTSRTFTLHPVIHGKRQKQGTIDLQLGHGDLLIMYGSCDKDFQHSIPSEPHLSGERLSLTFRKHFTVSVNH